MILLLLIVFIILLISFSLYAYNKRNNVHAYLISLPKNIERRQNFEKYYKGDYEYIEAIDATTSKYTDLFKNWGCLKPDGNNGAKALQLSNCKIFDDAIKKNYTWIVIFEDDAEPVQNFNEQINYLINIKYRDSPVIYLDARNKMGEGVRPGCCLAGVLYHKSVFHLLSKELNPLTSSYMQNYNYKPKKIVTSNDCIFDYLLANLLEYYNIKTSSEPIVYSDRFESVNK
jgi:hypothetical protein